ncbi:MAG: AraC family transcriptional regulator ligand-binding domain-containing protein, partial [Caulobacteraceae bacterium]
MVLMAAREAGADVDRVLAGTNVTAEQIEGGAESLPFEVLYRLAKALPDEGRGGAGLEVAARTPVTIHGAVGAAVSACESLGEALRTIAALGGAPARVLRCRLDVGQDFADLTMTTEFDLGDVATFVLEADAVLVARLLEAAVGKEIAGLE